MNSGTVAPSLPISSKPKTPPPDPLSSPRRVPHPFTPFVKGAGFSLPLLDRPSSLLCRRSPSGPLFFLLRCSATLQGGILPFPSRPNHHAACPSCVTRSSESRRGRGRSKTICGAAPLGPPPDRARIRWPQCPGRGTACRAPTGPGDKRGHAPDSSRRPRCGAAGGDFVIGEVAVQLAEGAVDAGGGLKTFGLAGERGGDEIP